MKLFLSLFFLLAPGQCGADTFILKDGGRLEGEVTGEMDGVVQVKTKYGPLSINRADIQEQQAAQLPPPAAPPTAPAEPVEASTAAVTESPVPAEIVEVSTAAAVEAPVEQVAISTAPPSEPAAEIPAVQLEGVVGAAPALTFRTTQPAPDARLLVYYENGVAVATETYDSAGTLLASEGRAPDGTYTEYYEEGGLKTVKTMMGGKANGTLKAYYPSGALQAEAYYFVGAREGLFKYFTEEGRPLMEADYRNDKLHGWKKDYGPDGAVAAETYYQEGFPSEAPGARTAASAAVMGQESAVTAKITILARGESVAFRLNGRYVGKIVLDREFNVISQNGKLPDGSVKVYSEGGKFSRSYGTKASGAEVFNWEGKVAREFLFTKNVLTRLRTFNIDGGVEGDYTYSENKAIKK
ncbi:MAG TPA: hypothetical protein DEQ38_07215 [Elusimicrobia bacterium]|nr:MAG: hypothetical protein A2089_08075 [Elusimicrobia bacterium GWD2_63_28]HCC47888.1 hypothetical protein [Elusimicrobiota bacterium]